MKVRLESLGLTTMVVLEGRLDFGAAAGFQARIEQVLATSKLVGVIVDCAGLDYVSSAGLRLFLLAARAAQRRRPFVRDVCSEARGTRGL